MADPITVSLKEPIANGSETIASLTIRAPKAKDFRGMPLENQTMGDIMALLSKLTGQPPSVLDELGVDDMTEAMEIVGNFMPGGRATGKKRSRS